MGQFQGFLGERMDVLHNGMGSAQWAMFGQPGTQVAAAETVLADASPSPAMGGSSMVTPRNGNTISMFGGVSGNWASVEGDTNGPGFDQDTVALNAGVDYAFSSETVVGLGGSYQTSELEFESDNSGEVDTVAVGLFGTFGLGGGYLDTNANVGFHDVNTSRLTPALDYASAEYSATSWSLSGELGSVIPVGRAYVSPMLSMTYVGVSVDGFTETGSALALTVDSADTNSFATVLGARAGNYFKVGKATVNLQGNLGWRHEFGDEESSFTAAFVEAPALLFNVDSSKIASDSATFGLGTTVSLSTRMEVFVNYDGVWNAEANSHNAALGVRTTW
jgi:outer membrane autotransporter protein